MTNPSSDSARRRRWLVPTIGAAVAVVVTVGTVAALRLTTSDRPSAAPAAAVLPQTVPPTAPGTSADPPVYHVRCMAALADTVAAAAPDPATAGRYTYIHTRWWGEDSASSEQTGTSTTPSTYESKLWRAADGSGRHDTIAIPGVPSRPDDSSTYTAGGLPDVLPEPIPTSPQVLATQLQSWSPPQKGPHWVLDAVADLYKAHATPQQIRVALLRVLASQNTGLECEGSLRDRAGRTGIAVAVNSDTGRVRHRLIFDPVGGQLFAEEQVFLRNPPALSGRPVPRTASYWLHLESIQVDRLPPAYVPGAFAGRGGQGGRHG